MKRMPRWAATRGTKTGCTLGISKMASDAAREGSCGTTDNSLRGNGGKVRKTVLAFGVLQRVTITRANGATTSKTARGTLSTVAAPNIADIFETFSSTARARSSSSTAINTAALMSRGSPTDTGGILGRMEMFTRGNSERGQDRARGF